MSPRTALLVSPALQRWLGELISHQPGSGAAVVGVNLLPRTLSALEVRALIEHLQEIDCELSTFSAASPPAINSILSRRVRHGRKRVD